MNNQKNQIRGKIPTRIGIVLVSLILAALLPIVLLIFGFAADSPSPQEEAIILSGFFLVKANIAAPLLLRWFVGKKAVGNVVGERFFLAAECSFLLNLATLIAIGISLTDADPNPTLFVPCAIAAHLLVFFAMGLWTVRFSTGVDLKTTFKIGGLYLAIYAAVGAVVFCLNYFLA